ncbi:MAG: hypothetical protein JRD39_04880 [Deltaproteobacteria bacterium]|jgi:hypothetical protein|nr:hypothetical protein [Deltaproteobacteria bacterium]
MKITIDRNVVEFVPENAGETTSMETLWRILIDCVNETKSMTPIGEFVPTKQNLARFTIEGVPGGRTVMSEQVSEEDCTYLCAICNKYMNVKKGQVVPLCCGRLMEAMD